MKHPLIITIGREYGSGGREIGQAVAKALGIAFYDKELISLAAKKSGLSDEFIANNEQRMRGSFMLNLAAASAYSGGFFSSQYLPLSESIFISQAQVIRMLMELQEKTGMSYLFITHNTTLCEIASDRIFTIENKKIIERK